MHRHFGLTQNLLKDLLKTYRFWTCFTLFYPWIVGDIHKGKELI